MTGVTGRPRQGPQGLGYTNIHFHWSCLNLETNISERASRYALGINEMTGVTGRPRQPGNQAGLGRPRQHGMQQGRLADWQAGSLLWQPGCIRNGSG